MNELKNAKKDWENNTFIIDFGYIGIDTTTKEVIRDSQKEVVKIEFPVFTGSEKQISWAKDIRAEKVNGILRMLDGNALEKFMDQAKVETVQAAFDMIFASPNFGWLKTTESAHDMIEKRF